MYDVKRGDVWQLGKHRLMCRSCTDVDAVNSLTIGKKADCIFTSPPYANQRTYPDEIACWDSMMSGMCDALPVHGNSQIFVNLGLFYRKGHCVYYWHDWLTGMHKRGYRHTGWYIWDKLAGLPTLPSHGRLYPSHEFIFHFCMQPFTPNKTVPCVSAGRAHINAGMRRTNNVVYRRPLAKNMICADTRIADSVVRLSNRGQSGRSEHPAMFPTGLPEHYILAFTQISATVFDPFCGSGTTIIAAEKTGRIAYGMEIAPEYVAMALQRWDKLYPDQKSQRVVHGDR